ncbi:MAG: glycosyltransferase family 4 protein [Chloroflexi bacterium]|nr:glycosyltransferase family 4 protein [Chloroflexota bacterium]
MPTPLRILLIMNGLVREQIDGGCVRIIEIAKQWQRAGHEIHLMGSEQAGISCRQWGLEPTLHTSRWRGGQGRWWLALHSITVCLFLPLSLWRLRPDLIVTSHDQPYDVLPGVMLKLQRWRGVRLAVSVPMMMRWRFWRRQGPRWYNALAFLVAQRLSLVFAAVFADRTLALGLATARQLRGTGFPMRRAAAVAAGVDLAGIRAAVPSPPAVQYDAVLVGRLAASKGALDLIDAWQIVVAGKRDAKLAVIGDGPDGEAMKDRIRIHGLEGHVDFLGPILDTAEKFRWIGASRLFALPSHEESWSIAMAEAMALGVPVVAYDLPELLEVWGDAFHAVPGGDIAAFGAAVSFLLTDAPVRHGLAERGLARVSELDWSVIAERELELILGNVADVDPLGADPWLVASPESRASGDASQSGPPTVTPG